MKSTEACVLTGNFQLCTFDIQQDEETVRVQARGTTSGTLTRSIDWHRSRQAQESWHLAKQRYKPGLCTVVKVTPSEIAVTSAKIRLAEAHYDYKIADVMVAYSSEGRSLLHLDSALREQILENLFCARDRQDTRNGKPIHPRRAFRACLALHAPRSIVLADFFSVLPKTR